MAYTIPIPKMGDILWDCYNGENHKIELMEDPDFVLMGMQHFYTCRIKYDDYKIIENADIRDYNLHLVPKYKS